MTIPSSDYYTILFMFNFMKRKDEKSQERKILMFTNIKQFIRQMFVELLSARPWGLHSKLYKQSLHPQGASILTRKTGSKKTNMCNLIFKSEKYYEEK